MHEKAHVETNIASEGSNPSLNGSVVVGHQGWLLGYQYAYSTARAALTKNNVSLGFQGKDFSLIGNVFVND